MTEEQALKILFIEDMPEDLELAKRKIKSSGIQFESYLAENEEQFLKGLYEFNPDIIISDYLLPDFDGMRALEITLTYDDTIPFIILTGAANEEIIVDAMKAGANDYLLKERINRLPFAIQEAIKKRNVLLKGKEATDSLEFLSQILEQSPYSVISTDMEGFITSWNRGAEKIFGYQAAEVLTRHISLIYHENDREFLKKEIITPLIRKESHYKQTVMKRKNGESFTASVFLWLIRDRAGQATGIVSYTLDITKTVKAEQELQIKNQAIEHDMDGIFITDTDGNITYSNKAALNILGYEKKSELECRTIEQLLNNGNKENETLNSIKGNGLKSELIIRRKDGSELPAWLSVTNIKNESGETIAYMYSFVDITERKKAEKELTESEKLYRLLAENTLDCIWIMDMDLFFTYVNPAIYSMLGFTPEEWVGSNLGDHCDEENLRKMKEYVKIGIDNASNFPGIIFQTELFAKNRDLVPVEIIGKIVSDDGKPSMLHGTTRDITNRKKAEKALKESEEQLRLAMTVSEHGYWDWDPEKDKFYFSPQSYMMLGYNDQEFSMSVEKWSEMMHPEDREHIMPEIIKSIHEGRNFTHELRMRSKSGEYRWILARGDTFISDKKNRRAIGTLVDITERKAGEEQMMLARIAAEEANRCKNELLANMNHELRTPLNSVIGYTEVLIDNTGSNLTEEQKKYLQIINKSGNKLLELINNVLDIAQIESDGMGLKFTTFEPESVIKKVIRDTKMMAAKKKIKINVQVAGNVNEITADAHKFKEILYNLIENALKFTPEYGSINVTAEIKEEKIEVSVQDTGIGIEEKDLERIFDPFVQVDSSTTRRYGGAGLGLVLVKEYLRMHSGSIRVESEPGKGSKFTFTIPVYPAIGNRDI